LVSSWKGTFLAFAVANAMLLGAASITWPQSSRIGTAFSATAMAVNYPGILTSILIVGDETDERFGIAWSVVLTWIFSLPWLAMGAVVAVETVKERRAPQAFFTIRFDR
jgi:hypothetical protein